MNRKGFTLVEVIVILAVLSILAAMAVPMALRIFERTAEDTTREEMDNIKKALLGNPQKLQTSFRNDFGYLGDIGCLPSTALGGLDRLLTQGSLPVWTFDSTKQAGAGWKGPYITGTPGEDFKKDQLGNDYTYTPVAGTCPLTATLVSNGPDGLPSTADDITVTIVANDTTATIRGTVKNTSGTGLAGVPVEYYSAANNGVLTTTSGTTDANGNYSFSSAPFGQRAVRAVPFLVFEPGSVTTNGGRTDISFQVRNYSTSAYVITQVQAVFTGGANYDQIQINNNTVDNGSNFISGQTVNLDAGDIAAGDTTIAAGTVATSSMRVVVDSPNTLVPDITLSGGTLGTIELNSFNQNMQNRTITVTLNPGPSSSVVTFVVP